MFDLIAFLTITGLPFFLILLLLLFLGFIGAIVITIALNTSYEITN